MQTNNDKASIIICKEINAYRCLLLFAPHTKQTDQLPLCVTVFVIVFVAVFATACDLIVATFDTSGSQQVPFIQTNIIIYTYYRIWVLRTRPPVVEIEHENEQRSRR